MFSLLRDGMVHCEEIGTISSVNVGHISPDNCLISLISSCMCDVFLGILKAGKTTESFPILLSCKLQFIKRRCPKGNVLTAADK